MRVWVSSVVGHLMGVPPITPAEVERTADPEARPAGSQVGCQNPQPATCCLGDNCPSSGLYGSVGSGQVRLGGDSGESGLVRFSWGLWNDRQNDQ